LRHVVTPEETGTRADVIIARVAVVSRSIVADAVKRGDVRLAGAAIKGSTVLREGDTLDFSLHEPPAIVAEAESIDVPIVYEDQWLIVVDKPAGMTSHDVVSRCRRIFCTRKVGHAGTLDPMATGVLVVGVERATKILGLLTAADKSYAATIRLGQTTVTEDAEGELLQTVSAAGVTVPDIEAAVAALRGEISQIPSTVSAVKVGGKRACRLARSPTTPSTAVT